jgi:hypothetical protein
MHLNDRHQQEQLRSSDDNTQPGHACNPFVTEHIIIQENFERQVFRNES